MTLCDLNIYRYKHSDYTMIIYSGSTRDNLHFDISQRAFYLITSGSDLHQICIKLSVESDPEASFKGYSVLKTYVTSVTHNVGTI